MAELTDLELLSELGVEAKPDKKKAHTAKEERVIAGFEEIQKFVEEHGHVPAHGEDKDIFERLYATRLDQIRAQADCRDLVLGLDHQELLEGDFETLEAVAEDIDDDELLSQLGVGPSGDDLTVLKHVKPRAETRLVEEMASRTQCEDFKKFKPLFEAVRDDLDKGIREIKKFRKDAGFSKTDIKEGHFFILGGQTAYVASVGEFFKAPNGAIDARLRVIYSNGTESNILLRSANRAMYKDDTSRLISNPSVGPLFSSNVEDDDLPSGTIYVLRSKSDHPMVKENRDVVHKIGVTGGDVKKRIANAKIDPTFLMADVEIVATYKLSNINRSKMEKTLHKVLGSAKLNIEIMDRFGNPVSPQEWFLVPVFVIDEVVERLIDGTISDYVYDASGACLKRANGGE